MLDSLRKIDPQNVNRGPTDGGSANQHSTIPEEMLIPTVEPGIKQPRQFPTSWIDARNVRTFIGVACIAANAEIILRRSSAMLGRNDMIDLKR
jgi:hypothetical protein